MIRKNKGFNLIELMVSILIASIIISGMYSLLTSSIVNYGFSKGSAAAGASSRRINNTFNSLVFQTGYLNFNRVKNYGSFQAYGQDDALPDIKGWRENEVIRAERYSEGDSGYGDAFKVRFYGSSVTDNLVSSSNSDADGYVFDCKGQPVKSNQQMELLFKVTDEGLVCYQNDIEHNTSTRVSEYTVIDPNVVHMTIQVGFALGKDITSGEADHLFYSVNHSGNIDSAPVFDPWTQVRVLRYALVTSQPTGQKVVKRTPQLRLFPDASTPMYTVTNEDGNNVHRVVNGTIQLVNRL